MQKTEVFVTKKVLKFLLSATVLVSGVIAHADNVDVPKDELTQETVYPVFDNPVSVKNRNVQDAGALDIGVFGGLALTEPISSTTKVGADINYHINYFHSVGVFFAKTSAGLSKDAQGLKDQFGLDFNRAPKQDYSLMVDYNYKAFYGKLSLTSNGVINTTIYGSLSGGMVTYVHKSYPALAIGIGERFYFTNKLSLKLDLRLYAHTAPIPFKSGALRNGTNGTPVDPLPSYDSFEERLTYTTNLELGLNYLF
ncbi:MAG: outer membrane beta-barrel domain-containing protein [Bdellovibrio sp.]|nr:outer membrane beta-barrel domain-containing protein [Bdellovibrio sp.]